MRGGDNRTAERILEDAVAVILGVLKDEGHIIEDFQLMRSKNLPDFWVLDSRQREYLVECKNPELKSYPEPVRRYNGTSYQGVSTWFWNANWVKDQILGKDWNRPRRYYPLRADGKNQDRYRQQVDRAQYLIDHKNVKPHPILIFTYDHFEADARDLLTDLFGWRTVFLGSQLKPGPGYDKTFSRLQEQLRYMFTR